MLLPSLLFPLLQIPLCMSSSSHGTCNHPFLLKDLRFLIAATTDLMGMQLFSIAVQGTHTHQSGLLLFQEQCEIHYIHILPASLPRKINVLKLSSLIDVPSIHPHPPTCHRAVAPTRQEDNGVCLQQLAYGLNNLFNGCRCRGGYSRAENRVHRLNCCGR